MFDLVQLRLIAGNGGNGRVSFRREKYVPKGGPDGGNGGDGGNIILKATRRYNTLQHFAGVKEYVAESGQPGGKQNQEGNEGEDLVIEVPVGTRVWLMAENHASRVRRTYHVHEGQLEPTLKHQRFSLSVKGGRPEIQPPDEAVPLDQAQEESAADSEVRHITRSETLKNVRFQDISKLLLVELLNEDDQYLICKGGQGGRGNDAFKGSTNTTPVDAEYGTPGERKVVLLELRLIADVGLVGFPNAGKSTFLSIVSRANPKIANYPFTTLEPNLGVMFSEEAGGRDIVMADIPGLIEGASQGKGLGYEFLRHIQACQLLLFVLSLDEALIFEEVSVADKAQLVWDQYQVLVAELKQYDESLLRKPFLVSLSKSDLYSEELLKAIKAHFAKQDLELLPFSAVTKNGVNLLQRALRSHLDEPPV